MANRLQVNEFPIITEADILGFSSLACRVKPWVLGVLANAISEDIEDWLHREVLRRVHTLEKHDGTGTVYLKLNNPPVHSITEIRFRGVAFTAEELADVKILRQSDRKDTGARLERLAGWSTRPIWNRPRSQGIHDPIAGDREAFGHLGGESSSDVWEITYDGGLDALPANIFQVGLEMADLTLERNKTKLLQSERLGDYSYQLQAPSLQTMESDGPQSRWRHILMRHQKTAWR